MSTARATQIDPDRIYNLGEASLACRVARQTITSAIASGALSELPRAKRMPGSLVKPARRIRGAELLRWFQTRQA